MLIHLRPASEKMASRRRASTTKVENRATDSNTATRRSMRILEKTCSEDHEEFKNNSKDLGKNLNNPNLSNLSALESRITVTLKRLPQGSYTCSVNHDNKTGENNMKTRLRGKSLSEKRDKESVIKNKQEGILTPNHRNRKRSVANPEKEYDNDSEVDENEMKDFTTNLQSKRTRSTNQTTRKSEISMMSPTKAFKSMSLNDDSTPKTRQRRNIGNNTPLKEINNTPRKSTNLSKDKVQANTAIRRGRQSSKFNIVSDEEYEPSENSEDDDYCEERVDENVKRVQRRCFKETDLSKNQAKISKRGTSDLRSRKRSVPNSENEYDNDSHPDENHLENLTKSTNVSTRAKSRTSEISMKSPTKAFKGMSLNDDSTPKTRQRRNTSNNTPLKEINNTPRKSTNLLKVKLQINKAIGSSKQSSQFNVDSDEDYEPSEQSEDDDESAESVDENIESETDSDESEIYSPTKRYRRAVKTQKSISKRSKTNLQTPTKNIKSLSNDFQSRLSMNALTPVMHKRTANIAKPSTPLQEARLKLHVSVLPKSLPCREEQFNDIYTFLHTRLSDKSGGCIYISGVPGTGKTATVNEVIRCLKKSMDSGKLSKFDFVDINGMKLSEPRQAYVQICKQLTGETRTWEDAQKQLHTRFTKSNTKGNMTLLLVDELDLLCTKRQDVVYNLLDWPSKSNAKLVVVTIANTMDLPERILMGKVTSRLGLTRLTFPPYNHQQLEEIVLSRMKGFDAFKGDTVQLVARKVAAVSGDARRALDICRRATEIAEVNNREMVSMMDVQQALAEMIASPKIQAIKHCSDMERVFLQAVCVEVERTGVEEVVFKNVYSKLVTLCRIHAEIIPNVTEALSMCARLGSWRLLICDHSKMDIHQRLLLNLSTDDVHFATKDVTM